jgi:hypothetical protein
MSTDLSGHAENASTEPEERADLPPSDAAATQPAAGPTEPSGPGHDLGDDQTMASTDELGTIPARGSDPRVAAQGPGDYTDNVAVGEDSAPAASPTGATGAEATQQVPAQAHPEPASPSTKQAAATGQSFIGDASDYARRWDSIQVGFVDDPQAAVREAETLVSDVMGEVVATFQQQRQQLETQWSGGGQASTDDLRAAFQRYRDFFQRLLQI